jgi:hypothetical protein
MVISDVLGARMEVVEVGVANSSLSKDSNYKDKLGHRSQGSL